MLSHAPLPVLVVRQRLNAGLVLVVPDLDESVISPGHDVGLVPSVVIVDAVDALLVALQGEVGGVGALANKSGVWGYCTKLCTLFFGAASLPVF